jgi:hypothetical protein
MTDERKGAISGSWIWDLGFGIALWVSEIEDEK